VLPETDIQTLRPVAGEEWRWVDAPPEEGFTPKLAGFLSRNLLLVEDQDEEWEVSSNLLELAPSLVWRRGILSLSLDTPFRSEIQGETNFADPRVGFLLHGGGFTARSSLILPVGGLDWPLSWNDWRGEEIVSFSTSSFGASAGASYGSSGLFIRGSLGGKFKKASGEVSYSRGGLVEGGEATFAYQVAAGSLALVPFVSVGFLQTPGTPSLRVGATLSPTRKKTELPAPVPAPLVTAEVAPVPEAAPEPVPVPPAEEAHAESPKEEVSEPVAVEAKPENRANPFSFTSGKSDLSPVAKGALDRAAGFFILHKEVSLFRIEGHAEANEASTKEEVLSLALKRAEAVRDYLVEKGLDPKRMEVVGQPPTGSGNGEDRRVDFIIVKKGG